MALSRLPRRIVQALLLAVASYYAVLGGEYSAFDLRRLSGMHETEAAQLDRAREEVAALREQAGALDKDPATLERVARERFGMIRQGETMYRFIQVGGDAAADQRVALTP